MSKDYKPYYRTDKMKQEELRTAKYVSILFFTMVVVLIHRICFRVS